MYIYLWLITCIIGAYGEALFKHHIHLASFLQVFQIKRLVGEGGANQVDPPLFFFSPGKLMGNWNAIVRGVLIGIDGILL